MNTTEKRKLVCKLLKNGGVKENGMKYKPSQPSKVIYNLKNDQLNNIIDNNLIDWRLLKEVANRIWSNSNTNSQQTNDDDKTTEKTDDEPLIENNDDEPSLTLPKVLSENTSRQYVTNEGMISGKQLYSDLGLDEFSKSVEKYCNAVTGGVTTGNVTINIENGAKITLKNEHLHPSFERILFHTINDKNVYLYGSAGAGKTTTAMQIAKSLDADKFACYSCSAGMSESMLTGKCLFDGRYFSTEFVDIVKNGGVVLLDEFDAIDGNLGVYLNSFLANGILHTPNNENEPSVTRHEKCYIICAGNTDGNGNGNRIYSGRNKLDGATLDRFTTIEFKYDSVLERKLAGGHSTLVKALRKLRQNVEKYEINRVVSTRQFLKLGRWMSAGKDLKYCINTLTESWTEYEIEKAEIKDILFSA